MQEEIVNRVAKSSLISIDLDDYVNVSNVRSFDIAPALFQGLILREKEFRIYLKELDWSVFQGKCVYVFCSADAIIPTWAYMLVATKLSGIAEECVFGDHIDIEKKIIDTAISEILKLDLVNSKVVIKGCGEIKSRDYAYFQLSKELTPLVSSIMYGEPCSTVPVYKRPK